MIQKEKSPVFDSAHKYNDYAEKYPVYKTAISRLVKLYLKHCHSQPKKILDIACGTGIGLSILKQKFSKSIISGIDKSLEMTKIAKSRQLKGMKITNCSIKELSPDISADVIFCNAAFWYFDNREKVLKLIRNITDGFLVFNISEPAVDLEDELYDDRFLQTMVEVLDDFGIVFHRDKGYKRGRLKLSYKPPTIKDIESELNKAGFKLLEYRVWKFKKSLGELAEFYLIPGFGTKAFRELDDEILKKKIIKEIVRRLESEKTKNINFRWAEFIVQ